MVSDQRILSGKMGDVHSSGPFGDEFYEGFQRAITESLPAALEAVRNMTAYSPENLIPLGRHVVGSACEHEGTCSDHDRKLLDQHKGREDTDA